MSKALVIIGAARNITDISGFNIMANVSVIIDMADMAKEIQENATRDVVEIDIKFVVVLGETQCFILENIDFYLKYRFKFIERNREDFMYKKIEW